MIAIPGDIRKILEYGIMAPSGDNCQPWRFSYDGNIINVFNDPKMDTSFYNWGQRASLVSHGALLQNIVLIAPSFGYTAKIQFFPKPGDENHVARVTFEKSNIKDDRAISVAIEKRTTNRKKYYDKKLLANDRSAILRQSEDVSGVCKLTLIEGSEKINAIAQAVSTNEQLLFENKKMHRFFYSHINWTEEEDNKKKNGFYIKTLEMPPNAIAPFRLFRHWNALNVVNLLLGFSKVLAKKNSEVYAASAIMGVLSISSEKPLDYVMAGMSLQKIWLTAVSHGLSMQPLTGVLFLCLRLRHNPEEFSQQHKKLIEDNYETIRKCAGLNVSDNMVVAFRLGYADAPSAKAQRYPLDYFIVDK